MHIVDIVLASLAALLVVAIITVLARQRFMLRATGAVPLALQRGQRWLYGVGRYTGSELQWYHALGIGTRPTKVLRRGEVELLGRRVPTVAERGSLPAGVVIVDCRSDDDRYTLALGESEYTGFVSWLESAAPA